MQVSEMRKRKWNECVSVIKIESFDALYNGII